MTRATNNSNRTYRKMTFQTLENRSMLAGNVAVSILNGDLRLVGDGQANEVAVFQTIQNGTPVAGSYFVSGVNGTTINGGGSRTFTGITRDLSINLAGGDDRLTLGDNVANNHFTVPRDLLVDLGSGANTLAINRITVRDDMFINTGTGADRLDIRGSFGAANVDNGQNDVNINTGGGSDVMRILNTFVRRDLNINTGTDTGSDLVDIVTGNIGRNMNIQTGDGLDIVSISGFGVNGDLTINTGAARDTVVLADVQVDELFADLGTGNDSLQMNNVYGRRATLNGGTGIDTLTQNEVDFSEFFQANSF